MHQVTTLLAGKVLQKCRVAFDMTVYSGHQGMVRIILCASEAPGSLSQVSMYGAAPENLTGVIREWVLETSFAILHCIQRGEK